MLYDFSGQVNFTHNAVDENETFDSGETTTEEDYRFVFELD